MIEFMMAHPWMVFVGFLVSMLFLFGVVNSMIEYLKARLISKTAAKFMKEVEQEDGGKTT